MLIMVISEWIDKMWHTYTMGHYSAIKSNKLLTCATAWMKLKSITPSE